MKTAWVFVGLAALTASLDACRQHQSAVPCQNAATLSDVESDARGGTGFTGVTITYRESRECDISGVPSVALIDENGKTLLTAQKSRGRFDPVILSTARKHAIFELLWAFRGPGGGDCPPERKTIPSALRVRLPHATTSDVISLGDYEQAPHICDGKIGVSETLARNS